MVEKTLFIRVSVVYDGCHENRESPRRNGRPTIVAAHLDGNFFKRVYLHYQPYIINEISMVFQYRCLLCSNKQLDI